MTLCPSEPALTFFVTGTPRPQPRPRFTNGRVVSTAEPKAKLWRIAVDRAVRLALEQRGGYVPAFGGAVRLTCAFTFVPPAGARDRLGKPHTHKPDASNLLKLIEDVMEAAGVFANDSQIADVRPQKWWGDKPGVVVLVEPFVALKVEPSISRGGAIPEWLHPARGA